MSVILNFFFIIQAHDWVTGYGLYPLPTEQDNCHLVEVTENEVNNSVNSYPKLDTLILVKSMIKNHSFQVMGKQNCCLFDTSVRLFVCQSVCLSVYLISLSVCLSVWLQIGQSVRPSVWCVCQSDMSVCQSFYLYVCLSIWSVCLSICLFDMSVWVVRSSVFLIRQRGKAAP